jgi:hypothetical protein
MSNITEEQLVNTFNETQKRFRLKNLKIEKKATLDDLQEITNQIVEKLEDKNFDWKKYEFSVKDNKPIIIYNNKLKNVDMFLLAFKSLIKTYLTNVNEKKNKNVENDGYFRNEDDTDEKIEDFYNKQIISNKADEKPKSNKITKMYLGNVNVPKIDLENVNVHKMDYKSMGNIPKMDLQNIISDKADEKPEFNIRKKKVPEIDSEMDYKINIPRIDLNFGRKLMHSKSVNNIDLENKDKKIHNPNSESKSDENIRYKYSDLLNAKKYNNSYFDEKHGVSTFRKIRHEIINTERLKKQKALLSEMGMAQSKNDRSSSRTHKRHTNDNISSHKNDNSSDKSHKKGGSKRKTKKNKNHNKRNTKKNKKRKNKKNTRKSKNK